MLSLHTADSLSLAGGFGDKTTPHIISSENIIYHQIRLATRGQLSLSERVHSLRKNGVTATPHCKVQMASHWSPVTAGVTDITDDPTKTCVPLNGHPPSMGQVRVVSVPRVAVATLMLQLNLTAVTSRSTTAYNRSRNRETNTRRENWFSAIRAPGLIKVERVLVPTSMQIAPVSA
jgi:hypothetical protein